MIRIQKKFNSLAINHLNISDLGYILDLKISINNLFNLFNNRKISIII